MKVEERWGSASFTHTLAEIGWMASLPVLLHLNERATGDPARDWLSAWARRYFIGTDLKVLVLGCGEGWLERAISWPCGRLQARVGSPTAGSARRRPRSARLRETAARGRRRPVEAVAARSVALADLAGRSQFGGTAPPAMAIGPLLQAIGRIAADRLPDP